jgi:hypothetical protein
MKNFEWCKIDLITFDNSDVITTSGNFVSDAIYNENGMFGSMETLFGGLN